MAIEKKASAQWSGNIKKGKGSISTESGALTRQPYGFNTRFEGEPGTNPEELIGAAHAACFEPHWRAFSWTFAATVFLLSA